MANRSLRSFATGIIFATSVFTFVYYTQPAAETVKDREEPPILTEDDIEQYLNEKGYVSIPKENYTELKRLKEKMEESATALVDAQLPQEKQPKQEVVATDEPPKKDSLKRYDLLIESGMFSIDVGRRLEKAGIIDDSRAFERFLMDKGWDQSIKIGTYPVDSSMSFEEIGRIITKR